ncbi:MAG: hypothetical protein GWP04_07940 [Gammaproteobacteria bacterium]|nr:hypothetical protein [Gammaproteobacteria bacterium]
MRDRAMVIVATIFAVFGFLAVRSYSGVPSPTPVVASSATFVNATDPPTPDGLSPALYRTLQAENSAWILPTDQAEQQLPASIVQVLESHNAVLRVADEATK